jgi:hypothetical protein
MNKNKRLLMQFAISALVAVATPAVAAGLVAGTSAAMEAANNQINPTIVSTADGDVAAPQIQPGIATHAPAKLSVLAGHDDAAWASAHSVHVDFHHK